MSVAIPFYEKCSHAAPKHGDLGRGSMVVSIDVDHQGGELLELVVAVLFEAFNPADGLLRDEPHLPGHPSHEVLRVRQSEVIRGHQRSSEALREATRPTKYCAYGAMARPSVAVRGTQR